MAFCATKSALHLDNSGAVLVSRSIPMDEFQFFFSPRRILELARPCRLAAPLRLNVVRLGTFFLLNIDHINVFVKISVVSPDLHPFFSRLPIVIQLTEGGVEHG